MSVKSTKNGLAIRLIESVIFLRGSVESAVHGRPAQTAPPGMLRGLLNMTLVKPTRISSIEIELEGKAKTCWPEGQTSEGKEERTILYVSHTFFNARTSKMLSRRTRSAGPIPDDDRGSCAASCEQRAQARGVSIHPGDLERGFSSNGDEPPPFESLDTERGRQREKGKTEANIFRLPGKWSGNGNGRRDGDSEHASDCKIFNKGNYTFPVSFAIPSNSPTTLDGDKGSVGYQLKATVRRPGAFSSNLTATHPVVLVAARGDDDLEESNDIEVEGQWEDRLHYRVAITGKAFPIGGIVPIRLTLVPLGPVKVNKISAVLEERTDLCTQAKGFSPVRITKSFQLMDLKNSSKNPPPLLPLSSDYSESPLRGLMDSDFHEIKDRDHAAAAAMASPGPWSILHELQLPETCYRMHVTYQHKASKIRICHILKVTFRVQRGDAEPTCVNNGRREHFDITISTPIHILSCYCNPEWTSLPQYTLFASDLNAEKQMCLCDIRIGNSMSTSGAGPRLPSNPPQLISTVNGTYTHDDSGENSLAPISSGASSDRPPLTRTPSSESLLNRNSKFEQLMAGQSGDHADRPPSYETLSL
ncbi:hypothetical protein BD410DRAFT_782076 [Rickenella mellea]|uniref:Arrestin C-terminal-like domain-containing protein n=1 Tax=Rickenella mellea TaxID=50990 RepID=A0A4Y7QLL6_9AGAM|nr:hypothetical protein BD410DRAFT_782076 [Rickenella mellea]